MAHALPLYEGKCHNIHGHSYKLFVTVEGTAPLPDTGTAIGATRGGAPVGMVMDFSQIKRVVEENIISRFDHALVLPEMGTGSSDATDSLCGYPANLMRVPFQPTTENLLLHFASLLEGKLPDGTRLYSLKLFETETSSAELLF